MVHIYNSDQSIVSSKLSFLLLAASVLFFLISGCDKKNEENIPKNNTPGNTGALLDKPLAAFQNDLLSVAFDTATAIPVHPHIKDRSKMQDLVVTACLTLDQPQKALGYIEKIEDWRQGACYADLAFYCVQHGDANNVQQYLTLADKISEKADQDWRRDRIKIKIAQTNVLLGQLQKADKLGTGVENSEAGKLSRARAMVADNNAFDEQLKMLNNAVTAGVFDVIKNELESATELFNRFYEDQEKRTQVEGNIKSSWSNMPIFIRIDLLAAMAGFAADHSDKKKSIELINEAQVLFDDYQWPLEQHIAYISKLVKLRCRVEDFEKAGNDADAALALFKGNKNSILNINRAGALRPLAEAYKVMGDTKAALSVYKMAVEEGTVNINSRPRAEDLSATCCSMALYAVEPDAELWARIHKIREALGNPW